MNKKVLILCDLFPPAFGPRMGYLCKYIRSMGWEPVVITEAVNENMFDFLAGECPVTYINYYTASHPLLHKLQWLFTFILDICFGYKDYRMAKEADKWINQYHFDVILCSTFRTFPLKAAQKTARKHHIPLVTDLRDIIEQYTGNEFITHSLPTFLGIDKKLAKAFKKQNLRIRNQVLHGANAVTTVSSWHVELLKQYNPNTKLIYNGFDPDLFYPEQIRAEQFIIVYTGRLLSTAMRDPSLLFESLSILQSQKVITPKECRVRWHVDNASRAVIETEARKAGVLPFMEFNGYIPASDIPSVLNRSSVLLLLTNKASGNGPKGIMTTKFFESLAVEKPILCVRSDESVLEAALHESGAGLAARNVDEACHFLQTCFNEWKEKGYTTSSINKQVLKNYSRKEQAAQFVRIFEQLIKS